MRAPLSFSGYQIFAALVPCELCLQLRGRDDPATAPPACVVGGSPLLCFLFAVSLSSVTRHFAWAQQTELNVHGFLVQLYARKFRATKFSKLTTFKCFIILFRS
jgi:hypothetical protein